MYTNTYIYIWQKYFDSGPLFPKEKEKGNEKEKDDSAAEAVRASHPPCYPPYALCLMPYAYTGARVAVALIPTLRLMPYALCLMPYAYTGARVAAAVIPTAADTSTLSEPAQRVELVA